MACLVFVQDDLEILKLKPLPGFQELIDTYKDQYEDATRDFVSRIMVYYRRKQDESRQFTAAHVKILARSEAEAKLRLAAFDKRRKQVRPALAMPPVQPTGLLVGGWFLWHLVFVAFGL